MESPSAEPASIAPDNAYAPTSVIAEHFRVERELGRGGMATVYLCTDLRTNTRVALKVLRQEIGSAVVIERFLREIAFASELDHPQIPKVFESGLIDGLPYYAMTYVEGESLKKLIEREKQLPIGEALRIACEVIKPTAYAHARGIVHRDLKPDNILIAKDGVFVLDFGIARAIIESGVDRLTSTGIGVGTPSYMSPEQALGDRNLDVRSDIYSLGCVVYEMIAGIPPFVGPTAQVIISRRFAAPPPPLSEVREAIPLAIEEAIDKALAKAPADRYASVSEFGDALQACVKEGVRGRVFRRRSAGRTIEFQTSSLTRAGIVLLAVALLAAGIVAWSFLRRSSFDKASQALASWDLAGAESGFTAAVKAKPTNAQSQLWLAQTMMLRGLPVDKWKSFAVFAAEDSSNLAPDEKLRAAALVSFTSGNYADACARMSRLAASRRDDFTSVLAYADCVRSDGTVVPDAKSPSGYRFQASYQLADSLYEGLLERNASNPQAYVVIVPRLEQVLTIHKNRFRMGETKGDLDVRFVAFPELVDDTLAYTPHPLSGSGAPVRTGGSDRTDAALQRNRQRLRSLAAAWAQLAPNDARPHATLARVLAAEGFLAVGENSALAELRRARELAASYPQPLTDRYLAQIHFGVDQLRLYLRLGRFESVGPLADSLLALERPQNDVDSALELLNPIAALRGRPLQVVRWRQEAGDDIPVFLPSGKVSTLPPAVTPDAIALNEYAAVGGPADSILAFVDRVSEKIAAVVRPSDVSGYQTAALSRPLTLAAPVIGAAPAAKFGSRKDLLVVALSAFAARNISRTRASLDTLAELHSDFAPGEITMDALYVESWLRAEIGDSSRAANQLDKGLAGLSAALPSILTSSPVTGSLVRAMALRADLAHAAHQSAVAKKWATAVIQLWGRGDAITAPMVARMRALLQSEGGT